MIYFNNSMLFEKVKNNKEVVIFKTEDNHSLNLKVIKEGDSFLIMDFISLENDVIKTRHRTELNFDKNKDSYFDLNLELKKSLFYFFIEYIYMLKQIYKTKKMTFHLLYLLNFETYYRLNSSTSHRDVFMLCAENYVSLLSKYKSNLIDINFSYLEREILHFEHLYSERFFDAYPIEFSKEGLVEFLVKEELNLFKNDFLLTYASE